MYNWQGEHINVITHCPLYVDLLSFIFRLHLDNLAQESKGDSHSIHVKPNCVFEPRFGFVCDTCCGSIPMPNEWESDWIVSSMEYMQPSIVRLHYIQLLMK